MSNQGNGEPQAGAKAQDNQNEINVEELNKKFNDLQAQLEAERKSKERILNESKEYKEKYQAFKSKEEEFKTQQAKAEEDRLRQQGEYKTLLEQREKELEALRNSLTETKSEADSFRESIVNLRKASAFERELGGKLKKDSYWNHVDFNKIALDPETGEIDKGTLKEVANNFVKEYKELVDFPSGGNLPNQTPNGGGGKLTYDQWKKLPLADRKKRMRDVVN